MASLATSRELRRLLRYLSDKWTVPVLDALADRRRRFGDLRGDCAITSRMLVRTLRSLGDKGIVARSTWPGGRLRVEYELTAFGRSLHTQLVDLQRWAKRRAPADTSITDGNVAAPPRPVAAQTVSDDSHGWSRLGHPGLKLTIATRNIHRASRIFARLFATTTPDISQSDVLG
ncbi:MAG: helix-turn-helix domain-containing protein, partial [Vicinamibacterales bacterium]